MWPFCKGPSNLITSRPKKGKKNALPRLDNITKLFSMFPQTWRILLAPTSCIQLFSVMELDWFERVTSLNPLLRLYLQRVSPQGDAVKMPPSFPRFASDCIQIPGTESKFDAIHSNTRIPNCVHLEATTKPNTKVSSKTTFVTIEESTKAVFRDLSENHTFCWFQFLSFGGSRTIDRTWRTMVFALPPWPQWTVSLWPPSFNWPLSGLCVKLLKMKFFSS